MTLRDQLEPFMANVDLALARHNPSDRETTRALENAVVRLLTEWQAGGVTPDRKVLQPDRLTA